MIQYFAFLRGINLGKRRLGMDHLRALFAELEFANVATFIASGNVAFETARKDEGKLERTIEKHLFDRLRFEVDTFVRTRAQVSRAIAQPPFPPAELDRDGNTIHVGFLKQRLAPAAAQKFVNCRTEVDELAINGREFYWLCRIRTPDSKVWSSPALRALRLGTMTMRNLSMLRRLVVEYPAH